MFRNFFENIKSSIEIKQSEKNIFRSLFIHSFLIGLSGAFFFVEASRNFILKVDIAEMPVAYILSGFTGYLLIRLFKNLQRKYGMNRSFELILLLFGLVMLLLFFGRLSFEKNILLSKIIAYIGFVLIFAFVTLFSLGFSGICLSIFNLSQSKRLLALLGTGEIFASILGYLIIPVLVKLVGSSSYLLLFSAVFSLLSIVPINKIVVVSGDGIKSGVKPASIVTPSFNLAFILKNPFVLYLSLTTLFSIVAVYFIDYSYLISVRYFSSLTGIEIATTVSILFSIIKTGELFFSFFSSNIISAAGMKRSVLLLPFLLIAGSLLGVFSLVFFNADPIFIIFFLFINKWTDRVVRKGITIPSTKIMFQINSPEERVQLQNNIDGVISQLSTIICGLLLVVVCYFTDTSNYYTFLKVTTLVCLLVFVIFLWFSNRLYFKYKDRIQEFLQTNQLATATIGRESNIEKPGEDNYLEINKDGLLDQKLNFLLTETNLSDQKKIRELICYYNPSANAYLNFTDNHPENETESNRKITKLYFENQNVFSRLLIMSNFLCLDFDRKLTFFKDIEKVTPLRLRAYYLNRLCSDGKSIDESQVFYFTELVTECVNEILWSEGAVVDLRVLPDSDLENQLEMHKEELVLVLLYLLQLLHDKTSVSLVRDIVFKTDRNEDDLLFVVELLENILRPELKTMILPIFEPISFANRRKKMNKTFLISQLNVTERLLDILMRDFNMVESYTKQLALQALIKIDRNSPIVKAFNSSKISNLQLVASSLDKDELSNKAHLQVNSISSQFCQSFSLDENDKINISRWAFKESVGNFSGTLTESRKKLFENNSTRVAIDSSVNSFLEVDLLAPVLLYKCRTL